MNAVANPIYVKLPKNQWEDGAKIKKIQSHVWHWTIRLLNKHTDLISSVGILAITTCLLAAKIFKNIPVFLPRLARIVFDFGGIIWLNVQVRDLFKSCSDFKRACQTREFIPLVETAAKVFLKTTNILLTCVIFATSVVAAIGFPQMTLALKLALRPLSLTALAISIAVDIRDYFANQSLLKELSALEQGIHSHRTITKVMVYFLENITKSKSKRIIAHWPEERRLADRLVRQLDTFTIETFNECVGKQQVKDVRLEAFKLYFALKDSMQNKQAGTKANLSLTALGYISMGICRAFPDSLLEMSTRWGMSVLYTDDLIRQKLFQSDLEKMAT